MPTGSEDSYDEPLPFLQGLLHGEGQGPPSQMPPPEVLGKYEVVGQLTQGTTTGVYLARDPHLDRRVSLRVIPLPTGCPESLERQQRDIRQATKLVHRNIVQLYDVETLTLPLTGQLVDCMVLEFIEGQTLEPQLPQLELTDRIRILEDVAHAIGHAHRQGIIHGCLRPASVLIATDRRTVVTDFGLFSFCGEGQSIPTNPTMDKLPFSSPEQLGGGNQAIDARSDVWALGVLLYLMLTDQLPFTGQNEEAISRRIQDCEPPHPGQGACSELTAIYRQALGKSPAKRYPDGSAFAEELARWRRGEAIEAQAASISAGHNDRDRQRPRPVVRALLLVGIVSLTLWYVGENHRNSSTENTRSQDDATLTARRRERLATILEPGRAQIASLRAARYSVGPGLTALLQETIRVLTQLESRLPSSEFQRSADAWKLLAYGWSAAGDELRAPRAFRMATTLAPEDEDLQFRAGQFYFYRAIKTQAFGWHAPEDPEAPREKRARRWKSLAQHHLGLAGSQAGIGAHLLNSYRAFMAARSADLKQLCQQGIKHYPNEQGAEQFWLLSAWHEHPGPLKKKLLDEALRLRPHYGLATLCLADMARRRGSARKAIQFFTRAGLAIPGDYLPLLCRANEYVRLGLPKLAIADLERATVLRPRFAPTHHILAQVKVQQGRHNQALANLDQAIRLSPRRVDSFLLRAKLHHLLNDHKAELSDLDQAIRLDPSSQIYSRRATARSECCKDPRGALLDANEAIRRDRGNIQAYLARGRSHHLLKQLPEAKQAYSTAILFEPDPLKLALIYYRRALVQMTGADWEAARTDLNQSILRNPLHEQAFRMRSVIWRELGNTMKSRADLARAKELSVR